MFWKLLSSYGVLILVCLVALLLSLAPPNRSDLPATGTAVPGKSAPKLWGSVLVACGVGAAVAWLFSQRFSRRLEQLSKRAAAIAHGAESLTIDTRAADEIGALARSFQRMQQELKERLNTIDRARRNFHTMLETLPEGVIALDVERNVLFANGSVARLFGLPRGATNGRKLWEVVRHPGLSEAVEKVYDTHQPVSVDLEFLDPPRLVTFRGRPLAMESGRGVILVLQDITELRRLERLRQEFIANVSHELKTPLAAIKAFTETLLEGPADDLTRERFLRRIDEQADRLHTLVLDMLALARVEADDQVFEAQPFDVNEVIRHCVESAQTEVRRKGLSLSVAPGNPAWIQADPEGLATVLHNLIDNAIKYTPPPGSVTVRTRVTGGEVLIAVEDTGVGIAEVDLPRIFERFYRVDKARSRALGGTGLGLSIVKHWTQAMGGRISVESHLQHGSTFTVAFPLHATPGGAEG